MPDYSNARSRMAIPNTLSSAIQINPFEGAQVLIVPQGNNQAPEEGMSQISNTETKAQTVQTSLSCKYQPLSQKNSFRTQTSLSLNFNK